MTPAVQLWPAPMQPFLATIIEQPDDDAPRLVYADWLEEQGDPLGEFIRVQVELASWPKTDEQIFLAACKGKTHATQQIFKKRHRLDDLRHRESALLAAHGKEWLCGRKCENLTDGIHYEHLCKKCGGTGRIGGYPEVVQRFAGEECGKCEGFGALPVSRPHINCGDCHGFGRIDVFHKGFPSRFSCTQAEWCGERCEYCYRSVSQPVYPLDWVPCPHCGDLGRIPCAGPTIVSSAPVTVVEFTDCPPFATENSRYGFHRWRNGNSNTMARLDAEVWDLLNLEVLWHDSLNQDGEESGFKYSRSAAAANSALSRAAILWARERAEDETVLVARTI